MEEYKDFHKYFNTLSKSEQRFLKILSIAYEQVEPKIFSNILKQCQVMTGSGTLFSPVNVVNYGKRLEKQELVTRSWGGKQLQCNPKYTEWIMRRAIIDPDFSYYLKIVRELLPFKLWGWKPRSFEVCVREMRAAIYTDSLSEFLTYENYAESSYRSRYESFDIYSYLFDKPFEARWLKTFSEEIQDYVINYLIFKAFDNLAPQDPYLDYILGHEKLLEKTNFGQSLRALLGNIYLLRSEFSKELHLSESLDRQAWLAFIQGKNIRALSLFDDALKNYRKKQKNKKVFFRHVAGPLYLIAMLKTKNKSLLKKIHTYCIQGQASDWKNSYNYIQAVAYHQEFQLERTRQLLAYRPQKSLDWLFYGLANFWTQQNIGTTELNRLKACHADAQKNGYRWMEFELANLLSRLEPNPQLADIYEREASNLQAKTGIESMLSTVEIVEQWEHALDNLLQLMTTNGTGKTVKENRLVWLLDFENQTIQPKEQVITKSGKWSKGRNVALKRLKDGDVTCLTDQDLKAANTIKEQQYGYYGSNDYEFDYAATIEALVGHPLLFRLDNPDIGVELVKKTMELIVEERNNHYSIRFAYEFDNQDVILLRETPTRYAFIHVDTKHHEIVRAMNGRSLRVPKKAKEKVVQAIKNLASVVTVHSEIEGLADDMPKVESDSTIYVHLLPIGDGFKLELFVKPFKEHPPYLKPGEGRKNVVTEIEGKKMMAIRDREREKTNVTNLEQAVPSLSKTESFNGEWHFEDAESCLNVLVELEPLKQEEAIVLEWPKGEKLKVSRPVGFNQLSMRIQRENDWFGLSGEVKISEDVVLNMSQLLGLMDKGAGSFIEISDGQYLALTNNFQKKLQELNGWVNKTKDGIQFHPLAAGAMEGLLEQIEQLEVDKEWKMHLNRLKRARKVKTSVPSTFKATLRNYQEEGFQWLSQLAYWGVGACLADDMGLGKTIQALAVMLERASKGSALVVAPASVARNWLRETEKFAPTLRPFLFGQGNRKKMVENLKPFDVLITSYGLLQQESELLASHQFNTVVLDEAQAIKNRSTKRSKAAMQIQSNFKIITTGTPIENHLGELWNLFNFLNPGLLGSLQSFQEKFAIPIEKYQDKEKQQHLKKLIQPFILRRRKTEVLEELPSKTEITLSVELSVEEKAFYEALRREAVASLEKNVDGHAGQKRMQLLAHLMKLRQACCNPKMVLPESKLKSSKMKLFGEIVEELIENGHKALIFSQFVKHLRLIEKHIKKKNIAYQYLDGQTPLKKREKRINAFQAGEGDLFLISLKAGGVGLNLTAADYVIHMDPWWNPAVEDQASDRAHRIGQKRPVTIYRLVTENTIEEKIVQLHHHKRDLADSLLEGTEASGKLTADELLNLITGD